MTDALSDRSAPTPPETTSSFPESDTASDPPSSVENGRQPEFERAIPCWVAEIDQETNSDERAQPWQNITNGQAKDKHFLAYQPWTSAANTDP